MTQTDDEIEGYDETGSSTLEDHYVLEDVMVRTETRTVIETVRRINAKRYKLDPDFQRDFLWSQNKQSKLIESCTLRIPLPVFYVAEDIEGRITVVDGLQRLTTFVRFLNGELKLKGLGKNHPLEGKYFDNLPIHLQERIEDTQLTLYILDKSAPEAMKLDIFDRVNSGVPLSKQQMRNALYNGPATQWLAEMATSEEFLQATGGSLSKKTMRDREAINRFMAFKLLRVKNYEGDMDDYLADSLIKLNNDDEGHLEHLREQFVNSMQANFEVFGPHAFRKSLVHDTEAATRSVINISLFDVMSVLFTLIPVDVAIENKEAIRDTVVGLLDDDEFVEAITASTNSTYQVLFRFKTAALALKEYFQ